MIVMKEVPCGIVDVLEAVDENTVKYAVWYVKSGHGFG